MSEATGRERGQTVPMSGDVIDQDGHQQVWKAHYWRHSVEEWEEFDSPEEAIAFLNYGEDAGTLSSRGVVWPDGGERPYDWVNDPAGVAMRGEPPSAAASRQTPDTP